MNADEFHPPGDQAFKYIAPQPVGRDQNEPRLERFPPGIADVLAGQIGPLANLRSSSGCGIAFRTDSPLIAVHLRRLRHHQMAPSGIAIEVSGENGEWRGFPSDDLRERSGDVAVEFSTGLRTGDAREVVVWLPLISTCAFGGIGVVAGSCLDAVAIPEPRWLVIGDSLTQGFSVQSPLQCWVHRLSRRWKMPAMNLGVGGLKIEPEVVRWALAAKKWELVTISLGSNHAWHETDLATVEERARQLAELAVSGGHARVVWCLPPYKPCEEGKGPIEFSGVPLDRETGARFAVIRERLRAALSRFPLQVAEDLLPHDYRFFPDGLHPFAFGHALYADNLAQALQIS